MASWCLAPPIIDHGRTRNTGIAVALNNHACMASQHSKNFQEHYAFARPWVGTLISGVLTKRLAILSSFVYYSSIQAIHHHLLIQV
jgi:hypothetical protein